LQKNASIHYVAARLFHAQGQALGRDGYRAAAHVPLPKITMSNSPSKRRFHATFQRNTTRATNAARSGVGAGYRSGLPPSQTQKSGKKRFFSGRCGWPFQPVFAGPAIAAPTLYMGPGPDINPAWLILPRKTPLRSAKTALFQEKAGGRGRPPRPAKEPSIRSEPFVGHLM
jgi:hypothetical protein